MSTPHAILRSVLWWHVESQQQARRNALLASAAMARLSHERREAEEFLQTHARRRAAVADADAPTPLAWAERT